MNLAIAKTKPEGPRMTLGNVLRGRQARPLRVVLYGVEGVGKSTWAGDAPAPVFLCSEDGTAQLDVARFPTPTIWEEVFEALRVIHSEPHDFKTLVFDTLDWLEPLCWAAVCKAGGKKSIEDFGYGKGYTAALDEWRRLLGALETVQRDRGMNVILLAHSQIRSFKNPTGEDYDRYELKLHAKAAGLAKEWAEAVLFAGYEVIVATTGQSRARGVSTGARVIYTTHSAAWDSKSRYGIPEVLPLAWADFAAAVEAGQPAPVDALLVEIERKAHQLGGELEVKATDATKRANGDATRLAQLNNWLNAKLAEVQPQEGGMK